jgi:hypothetical protein
VRKIPVLSTTDRRVIGVARQAFTSTFGTAPEAAGLKTISWSGSATA